jgi:hypothetical protein
MGNQNRVIIQMEDIYFYTRFSQRGVSWWVDYTPSGDECSIMDYIEQYCQYGSHQMSGKIPIQDIIDMLLKTILFIINRVEESIVVHLDTKSNMHMALMCLDPTIFN